jgi:hypothetical protein
LSNGRLLRKEGRKEGRKEREVMVRTKGCYSTKERVLWKEGKERRKERKACYGSKTVKGRTDGRKEGLIEGWMDERTEGRKGMHVMEARM